MAGFLRLSLVFPWSAEQVLRSFLPVENLIFSSESKISFAKLKNTILRNLLALAALLLITNWARAQEKTPATGTISGVVTDSSSGQPIEYATITVFSGSNKNPLTGITSDARGKFVVKDLSKGVYKVTVEFIGYKAASFGNVSVNPPALSADLQTIRLAKRKNVLQTVTITMSGKIIENRIDKIVYNAEQDLTSQGGVATDILKKVPQVSVDVDGNVELAGSSSIRFLIDGKPSAAFGNNIADVLQSIPASQIKSIEVVTNPGAKYDAQGLGGIINIILKKNTARGINGNISLTGGTRLQNGSLNFNARSENFGISAFVTGNARLNSTSFTNYKRVSENAIDTTIDMLSQDAVTRFNRHGIESGIGFDWTYKKRNSFSGSLNYDNFGNSGNGHSNQSQVTTLADGSPVATIDAINNTVNSFRFNNMDASLNYKRTFDKEDRELDIDWNSSFGKNYARSNSEQLQLPGDSVIYARNNTNPGNQNETEVSIDYTEPLQKNVILGLGGKINWNDITSNSTVFSLQAGKAFLFDSSLSNSLQYHQKVYAVYGEISFPAGKLFDVKTGARYERTELSTFYSNATTQVTAPGYNTFVPSVFLLKHLAKEQTIKLSYSKRIERPDYGDLNPFVNTSDPKNVSAGNPFLRPEIGNRYELAYSRELGTSGSFTITAFYRSNNHDIQPYIVYYPLLAIGDSIYTNVAVSKRQNIGLEKNMGVSLFGNVNFSKKLNIRTNIFIFHRHTINTLDAGFNSNSFNYRLNLNTEYQFTKSLAAEFFGNFNSARHEAQGSYPSFTTYSFAFRKQLWKKKGSLALTATNPFDEYVHQKTLLFGPGFSITSLRKIPNRSFGINFTWKFGKLEFKKDKEDAPVNLNAPAE
jgi:ferric enterobactin receptor